MAPKDYVARSKPKAKPAVDKKPLPLVPIIIALLGIIGFVVFLYFIKDNAQQANTQNSQVKTAEAELPELKESKWSFPKELEDKTVDVELPDKQLGQREAPSYVMQCGSFRKLAQAEEMKAKIAFAGLEAEVKKSNGKNGVWHRVVLGPYDKKRLAEKHRHRVKELGITSCRIW